MRETILLVEDDPLMMHIVSRMLDAIGFTRIFKAGSASEALPLWQKHKDEISLVLTDMNMPGMRGDELASQLLDDCPDLKIIFMSGNPPELLDTCIPLLPEKNFLQEPFSMRSLCHLLGEGNLSEKNAEVHRFYAFGK